MTIQMLGSARCAGEIRGEGPLVICSPAMGDEQDVFRPFADHLVAQGYRVLCLDLRGHGDSDLAGRYGDEATADDLLEAITACSEDGTAVLVGASMSAAAAVIAAGKRPEAVRALVLMAPFLRNGAGALMRGVMAAALWRPWGPRVWQGFSARLWPGLGDHASDRAAHLVARLRRPGRWRAFQRTARTSHEVVTPWLDRVSAPTLVVMGGADPDWRDPAAEAKWICDVLPAELELIDGVGHAPMAEAPERVGDVTARFLAGVSRAAGRS